MMYKEIIQSNLVHVFLLGIFPGKQELLKEKDDYIEGKYFTVEPRFNEPLFNEVLDIMNDIISMSRPKLP